MSPLAFSGFVRNLLYWSSPVGSTKSPWFCAALLLPSLAITDSDYICLVISSFLLSTHSGYFLHLLFSLSSDLWSVMLSLHCGEGLFSLSHHIQVFVGVSLSMHALRSCSLVHRIFHHVSEETETLLCLLFPRSCRKLTVLTWADAFPTRRWTGRKMRYFFPYVIDLRASQTDIALCMER